VVYKRTCVFTRWWHELEAVWPAEDGESGSGQGGLLHIQGHHYLPPQGELHVPGMAISDKLVGGGVDGFQHNKYWVRTRWTSSHTRAPSSSSARRTLVYQVWQSRILWGFIPPTKFESGCVGVALWAGWLVGHLRATSFSTAKESTRFCEIRCFVGV